VQSNKLRTFTKEHKEKLSLSHKGKIPWSKGKRGLWTSWNKGKKTPPHVIEKMKTSHIGQVGEKSSHWKGGKIERKCENCGKTIFSRKSEIKKGWDRFCSRKCKGRWQSENIKKHKHPNWKGGKLNKKCKVCGKEFKAYIGNTGLCSRRCSGIWNVSHNNKKNTSIELAIEKELINFNIPYIKQCPIEGISVVDFLLPNKTIIQCDGDYWHSFPKRINKDINQDFLFSFKGYKIFRFKESEINKSSRKCILKIIKQ